MGIHHRAQEEGYNWNCFHTQSLFKFTGGIRERALSYLPEIENRYRDSPYPDGKNHSQPEPESFRTEQIHPEVTSCTTRTGIRPLPATDDTDKPYQTGPPRPDSRSGVPAVSDSENPFILSNHSISHRFIFQERRKFFKLWQSVKEINVKFGR